MTVTARYIRENSFGELNYQQFFPVTRNILKTKLKRHIRVFYVIKMLSATKIIICFSLHLIVFIHNVNAVFNNIYACNFYNRVRFK